MNKLTWLIVAVVLVGGAYWWTQSSQAPAVSDKDLEVLESGDGAQTLMPVVGSTTTEMVVSQAMTVTVTYDGNSFTPAEVTVKKGGFVTFTSTGADMWVASAQHPVHAGYSGTTLKTHCPDAAGTAFDQCSKGSAYTFTFEKTGTWPYHNHMNLGAYGKVIVVE